MSDAWTVSELNRYVRESLESDFRLRDLRVQGEVSGFRAYPSGHWYFTLKDASAQLSCVMWRGRAEKMSAVPRDGDALIAHGNATLYEVRGQFQFDVAWLEWRGEGELYREFAQLKARLEADGLFAPERKRPLPARPGRIGLVTSPAGAALRDMLNVLQRRYPLAEVILAPTPVQGADAPPRIVAALGALAELELDVIIVARGGGSLEDLWAFNDERVARAIAALQTPVVSGVGHETDFTIADFVADLRAPTPSAAAELVTPQPIQLLREAVDDRSARAAEALRRALEDRRAELAGLRLRLTGRAPRARLEQARADWRAGRARLDAAARHRLRLERERLLGLRQRLAAVSPLAVLQRGYALVAGADGRLVRRAADVRPGDALTVRVSQGEFGVHVDG